MYDNWWKDSIAFNTSFFALSPQYSFIRIKINFVYFLVSLLYYGNYACENGGYCGIWIYIEYINFHLLFLMFLFIVFVFVLCFCLLFLFIVLNIVQSISQFHNGQHPKGNIDNKILRPFYGTLFLFLFRSMWRNARKCEKKDKMMKIGRPFIFNQMKLIQMRHQAFFVETLIVNMHW